ncbi:3-methyl-2-oxobutanoate hydroxymethyltransferase [Pelagibacteraceae bacterium]|jgi:3-methyl-2-oxobutanoate hydroxymethyltransferase|nr:3-methyl-2-oxobutanoate hydroxymethyltransferase [Pelagibacteraceae bacterium]|tara:strand:+ start:2117 stop:2905 length:789 start_codon:yes stop_codon:yes gene_type:complete
MNKKIKKIILKKNKTKIVSLTAYSKSTAKILDKHVDIVLVGDSMANVLYGHKNTRKISLDNIIQHTLSVKMGIKRSLLVVDMPKDSYNSPRSAEINAKKVIKMTKCDAIKIESNKKNYKIIKFLVRKKIPVMGHIGYTPQYKKKFKIEGQTKKEIQKLLNEAKMIEKAGAFSIVLECLSPKSSKLITNTLKIPTIGIGSSSYCDGQILVTDDMLGISGFYPKFVKKYVNLNRLIEKAVKKYTREVKLNKFPAKKNFLNGTKH